MKGKRRPAPTILKEVDVYGGRHRARLVREADPEGRPVVHARVITQWPLDRLLVNRTITWEQWDAGDRFRRAFEAARDFVGLTQAGFGYGR